MCLMRTFTMVKRETVYAARTLDLVHTNYQNSPNVNRRLRYLFQQATVRKASCLNPVGTTASTAGL